MTKKNPSSRRLDELMLERGLAESRSKAQALILAGRVAVKGGHQVKAGMLLKPDVEIELSPGATWVGRGGEKLAGIFDHWGVAAVSGAWLDCGASTGGFTQVLLHHGAERIYAMDVGYGQIDPILRNDPRVVVIDRFNIRNISKSVVPDPLDGITLDMSFISSRLVLPLLPPYLKSHAPIILLFKPQFEAGKGQVGKGGVIRDGKLLLEILDDFRLWCGNNGFAIQREDESPIKGQKGNTEFFFELTVESADD